MEKRMKNRLALLSILFIAGLLMAGIGTAVGAEKVLAKLTQGFGKEVKAVAVGDQVTIYEDGKAIQNFTLPEEDGATAVWEFSNGTIRIGKMTKEEIEKGQTMHELEKNRLLEIAKKDSRVQELIKGKEYRESGTIGTYRVLGVSMSNKIATVASLDIEVDGNMALGVEGKYYRVTIDFIGHRLRGHSYSTNIVLN